MTDRRLSVSVANALDAVAAGKVENCYGPGLKGNDNYNGAAGTTGAATGKVDSPAGALEIVPNGTCTKIQLNHS